MIGVYMFFTALLMLLIGFPVAFTFAGVALVFGIYSEGFAEGMEDGFIEHFIQGVGLFDMMPYRIYSIMENTILMAIPLFIFMGIILQKTKLAEQLLESMGTLFGAVRGGLAISTILVGALLAASTGVVGASVVAMGVISLPVMLKYGYCKKLATGVICASGTLGQIIPPSIVLIILGDVLGVAVGDLFKAAVMPGLILVGSYILYVLIVSYFNKDLAPAMPMEKNLVKKDEVIKALKAIVPPLSLIIMVLGSIFAGIATPTESSAVGGVGALLLAVAYKQFSIQVVKEAALETVKITAMVFTILLGATAFSMVFSYTGGEELVEHFMTSLPGEKWGFLILVMLSILVLGFFIDFVEITFIVIPIIYPIAQLLGIDMVWFGILIAMNLQTSFLTPPFGFALFYLKGVAPKGVQTMDIYKGVMPFILIQILILASIVAFPGFYGFDGFGD